MTEKTDLIIKQNEAHTKQAWLWSGLFGIFFSAANVWGYELEKADHISFASQKASVIFFLLAVLVTILTRYSWKSVDGLYKRNADRQVQKTVMHSYPRKYFFCIWGGLVLCQIPVLLAEYPGFFVYDAQTEVTEVFTRVFTTHHPLMHVLLLGGTVSALHKITGSYNVGICTYIICQMLLMTAVFAYVIGLLRQMQIRKWIRVLAFMFYGFFPTIVMYTLCSSKDGLFSAFLLLLSVMLMQMWQNPQNFMQSKKNVAAMIFAATGMMLMRNNGFYSYLVFVPIAFFMLGKYRKKIFPFLLLPLVLYLLISNTLIFALQAEDGEHQEMLTVPIQQLARTWQADPENFDETDQAVLYSYLSKEGLQHYTPRISDILKTFFDNAQYEKDSASFWKLWFKIGKRNPATYLNAWFLTSYGYWYPGAVINVYQGNTVFTFTYTDSSYFGYEVEAPGVRHSLIPAIDRFYRKLSIEKFQQNIPGISLLFAPAFWFWMMAWYAGGQLQRGNVRRILWMLPAFLTWLTVLLGPTYLVRYVIILWYIAPLYILTHDMAKAKFDEQM